MAVGERWRRPPGWSRADRGGAGDEVRETGWAPQTKPRCLNLVLHVQRRSQRVVCFQRTTECWMKIRWWGKGTPVEWGPI